MMWWNDYGPEPWMYFMPVFFMLLMIGCAVMMFFMMRGHRHGDNAARILKERFARGEIDKAEYDDRRRVLEA